MLKALAASLKPKQVAAPIVRFETAPGEQTQVDWAVIRRGRNRLSMFVATLSRSRASHVEFVTDERVETLIQAHENAFVDFGGVPHEVLYDNMRTVVLERHGYGRGPHRFHPGFLDFARHCGFRPRLCAPYRAQTKGKVERFIGYLQESFWAPLSSRLAQEGLVVDRETGNLAVKRWRREVATARIHGTTGAIPAERLVSEDCSCNRCRRLTVDARYALCRPNQSRCRSSACNTRCRCTMPSPGSRVERSTAPTPDQAVPGIAAQRRSRSLLRDCSERGSQRGLFH
jgi:hypothetical protein